jgi:hypothetical protein
MSRCNLYFFRLGVNLLFSKNFCGRFRANTLWWHKVHPTNVATCTPISLFPLKFTIRFIWIPSYIVRRSISYAGFFNIMQNHMIYVQNFTLIKSTSVWILSPFTSGIPNPTYKTFQITNISHFHWYRLSSLCLHAFTKADMWTGFNLLYQRRRFFTGWFSQVRGGANTCNCN